MFWGIRVLGFRGRSGFGMFASAGSHPVPPFPQTLNPKPQALSPKPEQPERHEPFSSSLSRRRFRGQDFGLRVSGL